MKQRKDRHFFLYLCYRTSKGWINGQIFRSFEVSEISVFQGKYKLFYKTALHSQFPYFYVNDQHQIIQFSLLLLSILLFKLCSVSSFLIQGEYVNIWHLWANKTITFLSIFSWKTPSLTYNLVLHLKWKHK